TDEAAAKRKAKTVPFGGRIDPYKPLTDTVLPSYMPRKGTALDVPALRIETPPLTMTEAALRLRSQYRDAWSPAMGAALAERYPDGLREEDLSKVATELGLVRKPALRAVGGL